MARKPREEVAGGIFHVTARGNHRREIFLDDEDRYSYMLLLGRVVRVTEWRLMAYCLMDNHVHLLVETPITNLGWGMQRLHGDYGRLFNDRRGWDGHLFQDRFASERLELERHLWAVAGYIACNPVRAGICARPEDWPWSSHAAVSAGDAPVWLAHDRLLEFLAAMGGGDPARRYAECVLRPIGSAPTWSSPASPSKKSSSSSSS